MLECQNCGWTGTWSELVALTDDLEDKDFTHCPECESAEMEDIEDEDE